MKTSELRIGNAIMTKDCKPCPVIITPALMSVLIEKGTPTFLPIPIILSQMERLGFKYKNRKYIMPNHYINGLDEYVFYLTTADKIKLGIGKHIFTAISNKEFKYIHEVQNVWYELTGEELTYKID